MFAFGVRFCALSRSAGQSGLRISSDTQLEARTKIYIWYLAGEIQKQAPQDTPNDSKQASSTASLKHSEQPYKHSKRDNKIHDNHTVYPWLRNGD